MRRPKYVLPLAAIGVLAFAAGIVSAARQPAIQTADVSTAFNATQTNMSTRTCVQDGNTFRITRSTWTGTATSAEPRLNGNLILKTKTVVNETTGDGWLTGSWRTSPGTSPPGRQGQPRSVAAVSAVIDDGNHADGWAKGWARPQHQRLFGNWSALINGDTITGELGANAPVAPDNSALLFRGGCPH